MTLRQWMATRTPDWRRGLEILWAVCDALAATHARGIVKRDLSPETIYIDESPLRITLSAIVPAVPPPEVVDILAVGDTTGFGLAPRGLEYFSPEQIIGKPLDPRSDIYALGVIGYELVTGRALFPDARGPAGVITAQLKQPPVAASTRTASVPPEVDDLLLACVHKQPDRRCASVGVLARAIDAALRADLD